jgi:hypothetical protein
MLGAMSRLIAIVGGCCALGLCFGQEQPAAGPVDLCTVANNIRAYNRQKVRITAVLIGNAVLYDPKCQQEEFRVSVSFDPKVKGKIKQMDKILKKRRYALVTVDGTMHGGELVDIDPSLPDWLKDRFKNSKKKYGHLGSFDLMIEIGSVVDAKDVVVELPKAASSR